MIPGIVAGATLAPAPEVPAYTPPNLSNLRYWFDASDGVFADDGVTPASDTDLVHRWNNKGAASDDAVQATSGSRPQFRTGGLNGKPYVQGASGKFFNDLLEGSQPSGLASGNSFSVIAVVEAVTMGSFLLGADEVTSGSTAKCAVWFSSEQMRWFKSQYNIALPNGGAGANIMGARRTGTTTASRGSHASAMADFSESTNANSTATNGMRFFNHGSTRGAWFIGRLYEMFWWNGSTALADMNAVIDHLQEKYGL